ncbi:unnamed protein product [Caenorhabditis angaria]|uniref:Piwi domain-containing protein n=1 Tax=Caenorhabditis angaria TaxID=860376 RepID=A0A9P1MSB2_9PELO|nr:unnamed protein product [Caenorhabditis angaria]
MPPMPPGPMPPVAIPPVAIPPITIPPVTIPPVSIPPVLAPPAPPVVVPPVSVPPAPVPTPGLFDATQRAAVDACQKRLKVLGLPPGPKKMVKKETPSSLGCPTKIQTNVFGLQLLKDTIIHSYLVYITVDLSPTKTAEFTKKGKEDFIVLDRHEKCVSIFYSAVANNPEFFKLNGGNTIVYDGQSLLFTTVDLFPGIKDRKQKRIVFEVNGANIDNQDLHRLESIKVEIYVGDRHRINFSTEYLLTRTADSNLENIDRSLFQFMELIFNQTCIRDSKRFACFEHGKVYILNPRENGFSPNDTKEVGDGKYLLPGLKKSIHFVEGPFGTGHNNPALVVDSMKAAFHIHQTVAEKIACIMNPADRLDRNRQSQPHRPPPAYNDLVRSPEKVTAIIKGLDVYSNYTGKIQHLRIEGIHCDNAERTKFDLGDGGTTTVAKYYADKYGIHLKLSRLNLLICKQRGNNNFFPMELMHVSPNQRVTIPQLTAQQSALTTRECAVVPFDRQRLVMGGMTAIGLITREGTRNELLHDIGIKIFTDPLLINAKLLPNQSVVYGAKAPATIDHGHWRSTGHYQRVAQTPKVWAIYIINGAMGNGFNDAEALNFGQRFAAEAGRKGIRFGAPAECLVILKDEAEGRIRYAAEHSCEYILMVTDSSITDMHSMFKLMERELGVVIQDLTHRLANMFVQGKKASMENVINKLNVKLGGTNYHVQENSISDDQLILGVSSPVATSLISHMRDGKGLLNPMCIGYSSNVYNPQEFIGDFTLTDAAGDALVSMEEIVENVLNVWTEKRKEPLRRLIIYRAASSEGAYGSILAYEVPLIRNAMKAKGFEETKLIYIMVNKDHNFRLFKSLDGSNSNGNGKSEAMSRTTSTSSPWKDDPNIPPGVLVDAEIIHPSFKQFFLNSHRTLQGSAKTPLYTVLVDEFYAGMSKLESMTYALCYHHQIVSLVTSLPSPLYVANEYAKRGRALWIQKTGGIGPVRTDHDSDNARVKEATKELSYRETKFVDRRVNA